MRAKTIALLVGLVFIAVGLLGFIDNPIVGDGEDVIFHADTIHNMVHIISGVLFFFVALASPSAARGFLLVFGTVYLLLGILGFARIGSEGLTELLGFLHVNGADNYLHVGLGVLILALGLVAQRPARAV